MNTFESLSEIDVTEFVKTKGGFNYLSWAFAISTLLKKFPEATWHVHEFPFYKDGHEYAMPYLHTPLGYFVKVSVTIDGITRTQLHPVLDHRNKPIEKPTTFEINTSTQRCIVKTIGLHGLGLYIYAGEDLPINAPPYSEEQQNTFFTLIEENDELGLYGFLQSLERDAYDALFGSFPKGEKTKSKDKIRAMNNKANEIINDAVEQIKTCVDNTDKQGIEVIMDEMLIVKQSVWDRLETEYQTQLREILK